MQVLLEEYGEFIVEALIGLGMIIIGTKMSTIISPFIETYIMNLM